MRVPVRVWGRSARCAPPAPRRRPGSRENRGRSLRIATGHAPRHGQTTRTNDSDKASHRAWPGATDRLASPRRPRRMPLSCTPSTPAPARALILSHRRSLCGVKGPGRHRAGPGRDRRRAMRGNRPRRRGPVGGTRRPVIRVSRPSQPSESVIRVSQPTDLTDRQWTEAGASARQRRAHDPARASLLSLSATRVSHPRRSSESVIRVAHPSRCGGPSPLSAAPCSSLGWLTQHPPSPPAAPRPTPTRAPPTRARAAAARPALAELFKFTASPCYTMDGSKRLCLCF